MFLKSQSFSSAAEDRKWKARTRTRLSFADYYLPVVYLQTKNDVYREFEKWNTEFHHSFVRY